MITNLIRKALAPTIENILKEERIRLQRIISDMEDVIDDVKSINASDIAYNISTYDIAQEISIDYDHIARNIDIDTSDIEVDTHDLADRIANEIAGNIDIDYSDLAREISDYVDWNKVNAVNARIDNVHTNLHTIERKMDLILKYNGITPENV